MIASRAQVEEAATTEQMITAMSRLFRYNLKSTDSVMPLERELKVVSDYMYLQQMRFGKRLRFTSDCPADTLDHLVSLRRRRAGKSISGPGVRTGGCGFGCPTRAAEWQKSAWRRFAARWPQGMRRPPGSALEIFTAESTPCTPTGRWRCTAGPGAER